MASSVEEEVTQYVSTGREESSEEQGELTAVYNVITAIQKRAFEAMDVLQHRRPKLTSREKANDDFMNASRVV